MNLFKNIRFDSRSFFGNLFGYAGSLKDLYSKIENDLSITKGHPFGKDITTVTLIYSTNLRVTVTNSNGVPYYPDLDQGWKKLSKKLADISIFLPPVENELVFVVNSSGNLEIQFRTAMPPMKRKVLYMKRKNNHEVLLFVRLVPLQRIISEDTSLFY